MFFLSKKKRQTADLVKEREIKAIQQPLLDKIDEATEGLRLVNRVLTPDKVKHITEAIAFATGALKR